MNRPLHEGALMISPAWRGSDLAWPRPMQIDLISKLTLLAMLGIGGACGDDSHSTHPDAGTDSNTPIGDESPFAGMFTGTAQVVGVRFLKTGEFPAKVMIYQDGTRLRGFLDVESTPPDTGAVDAPSYYFDGTVDGTTVTLKLSERWCGAAEPPGLCDPDGLRTRFVYEATGTLVDRKVTFGPARLIAGTTGDYAFEPPFERLEIDRIAPSAADSSAVPITGTWKGECHLPRDGVFSYALPMLGHNEMTIAPVNGSPTITRFVNEGRVLWPTDDDPILLGDTFKYDPVSGNAWFVSVWNSYGRWLYLGHQEKDYLQFLLVGDALDPPEALWSADKLPSAPLNSDFRRNFEGVCYFVRDHADL